MGEQLIQDQGISLNISPDQNLWGGEGGVSGKDTFKCKVL